MVGSGMPWPGDEGEPRWEQAWTAIKKVNMFIIIIAMVFIRIFLIAIRTLFLNYVNVKVRILQLLFFLSP